MRKEMYSVYLVGLMDTHNALIIKQPLLLTMETQGTFDYELLI